MNRATYLAVRGDVPDRVIAARAGISESHLSLISHGKRIPTIVIARRVAAALGTTVDALWPVEGERAPEPPNPRRFRAIPGGAPKRPREARPSTSAAEAGRAGGRARAENLTPEQRSESARKAVEARWSRTRQANPLCASNHLAGWAIRSGSNDGASYRSAA